MFTGALGRNRSYVAATATPVLSFVYLVCVWQHVITRCNSGELGVGLTDITIVQSAALAARDIKL